LIFASIICGRFPLLLEIYSPTDSTDIHRFYISQNPCSSVLSVGDSLCCLRFILPRIPQIFTDFIYPSIRAPLCYLWETPSHPISVFICAICGRFFRTQYLCSSAISVEATLCCLRLFSHRFHRYSQILYIPVSVLICAICGKHLRTQYPCSSVLSVGDSFARRWELLFLHRQRDAASALIHFRYSHHNVLV